MDFGASLRSERGLVDGAEGSHHLLPHPQLGRERGGGAAAEEAEVAAAAAAATDLQNTFGEKVYSFSSSTKMLREERSSQKGSRAGEGEGIE